MFKLRNRSRGLLLSGWLIMAIGAAPPLCRALEPEQVLVLANRNASASVGLAREYMKKRGIPEHNLLNLWVTDKEWCEREEYEGKIARPVRNHLKEKDPQRIIRCILVMYGLPLKVAPPKLTEQEKGEVEALKKQEASLKERLKGAKGEEMDPLRLEADRIRGKIALLEKRDQAASLDSEIALVLREPYSLSGWMPNPFFAGYTGNQMRELHQDTLMTARLDGPSVEIVRRVIAETLAAEGEGLKGRAYFDARWPRPAEDEKGGKLSAYAFYDRSIHRAADAVKKSGKMEVVVNDRETLFQPGECPDAALYCGWYSLARYVDAFSWRPGSIGYHIASAECQTLKQEKSQVWCKRMLEEGIASTTGPVDEPYVQAFPVPEIFFGCLVDGRWALAECYAFSTPFLSWQMVLVGDPLYRPFGKPHNK